MMRMKQPFLIGLLILVSINACFAESDRPSTAALEQRLSDIDAELDQLAAFTLRNGIGSVGYRSLVHQTPDNPEWVRIELGEEVLIDSVVLVPTLFLVPETGFLAEGFPEAFRILAGSEQTTNVVAEFSTEDGVMPRIAPLTVSFPPVNASWLKVEANTLSPRLWDNRYVLQLSEIMVFSGHDNAALNKPVTLPDNAPKPIAAHDKQYLVDGFTPYLMDTAGDAESKTRLLRINDPSTPPTLTINLGTAYPVSQVNLHTANLEYSVPMSQYSNRAVPRHIRIKGANRPDFSDAAVLCEHLQESLYDNGPIIILRFPETECTYVRLEILDPRPIVSLFPRNNHIAFSEIEVISNGQNTALHAPVEASTNLSVNRIKMDLITDGLNYYGEIIPIRTWMNQLSRRHDLEKERPLVSGELHRRYERQKTNLRRLGWLSALLAGGIAFTILIDRLLQMRKLRQMEQRIAADLHDELGANLHTIGLLSDLADEAKNEPDELNELHQRIRAVTERSGVAVRNCTHMHDTNRLHKGLIEDMHRAAARILDKRDHSLDIEGEKHLINFSQRTCFGLFLFYKECLINISRHSCATQITTQLRIQENQINLTVTDNGQGLAASDRTGIPPSLKRRAKLLRAKLTFDSPSSGGTRVHLSVPAKKIGRRK